jgi:hypothetical protein
MTQQSLPGGLLWYPPHNYMEIANPPAGAGSIGPMDAAAEKIALIGRIQIQGRPASKTISSAGGKIHFNPTSVTWANVATALDIGIQDTDGTTFPVVPDGTFDVKTTLVPGTDTLATNTWKSAAMTTGTKTIANGDLIAVVFDMTARGGADAVSVAVLSGTFSPNMPSCRPFVAGAWGNKEGLALVVIEFDDGTFAKLEGGAVFQNTGLAIEGFADATNPDERGMAFSVPWACSVAAAKFWMAANNSAAGDSELTLYSDPLGTPTALITPIAIRAEDLGFNSGSAREVTIPFVAPIALTANAVYAFALKATGTANINITPILVADANYKVLLGANTDYSKVTRNAGTGAFSATAGTVYWGWSIGISALDDGAGGAGGGMRLAGHGGLAA